MCLTWDGCKAQDIKVFVNSESCYLFSADDPASQVFTTIPTGNKLKIMGIGGIVGNYIKTEYHNNIGYVLDMDVIISPAAKKYLSDLQVAKEKSKIDKKRRDDSLNNPILISNKIKPQKLDRFFGMKFRSNIDSIKNAMLSKPECKLIPNFSNQNMLSFSHVKFAGKDVVFMAFKFFNKKFFSGVVLIRPSFEGDIINLYNNIRDELNEKYFKSEINQESYEYPFSKDIGNSIEAIKLHKATFLTIWMFASQTEKNEDNNGISLTIT